MRSSSHVLAFLTLLSSLAITSCQPAATPTPDLHLDDPWARPSRTMSMGGDSADTTRMANVTSAVYLSIHNAGSGADTLLSARTDVARAVEIHESRMDEGVMRMRQVMGLEIPARATVELKPGGYHLMLIGVNQDLVVGDEFGVTLSLARSGERTIDVVVRQPE